MTDQTLEVFEQSRTVRALVLPFGETGNGVMFDKGVVEIPEDAASVKLRINHPVKNGPKPVVIGHGVSFEETDKGIVGTFEIENNVHGDRLLQDHASGRKTSVSAEVANFAVEGARVVRSTLQHVAAVVLGAFPSAAFFALDEEKKPFAEAVAELGPVAVESITHALEKRIADLEAQLASAKTTDSADADEETENESDNPATNNQEDAVAEAVAPNTASLEEVKKDESANAVFDLVTRAKSAEHIQDRTAAEFALQDITPAIAAPGVLQPTWLGEVWSGVAPTRRYANLIKNGNIVAFEEKGFKLSTGSELVKPWSGNKAELPTGTATTSIISGEPLQRWAFAADFAQEFFLIEAGRPVVEAFIREVFNSYARVSDKYALERIYNAAGTAVEVDNFPADYNSALAKLIQGVDTIDDSDVSPTFAVVAPDVWTTLRRTPKDELPEFVTFTAGRQDGTADGVRIVRDKAGVLGAGEVLVGSSQAAHLNELAGSPIQLDALDIAHGGLDKSVIGMAQYMTEYADGFIVIGDAE